MRFGPERAGKTLRLPYMQDAPEVTFRDLNLPEWLVERIADAGYTKATPIQAAAVPEVRAGADVVAQAQTGTGKTAAFVIPILSMLNPADGPVQVLFLAPTRELSRQVCNEFDLLGEGSGIEAFAIYGGVSMEPQIEAFQTAHILVCTPGRLLDHLRRGTLKLNNLRIFGLDEADEMLSMGFEREITEILRLLPEKRQNLLFSATMPREVLRFADNFLVDPRRLNLSSDSVGARSVHHVAYNIQRSERLAALRALLRSHTVRGAIIFANTKSETFRVTQQLEQEGYSIGVLNGDLPQKDRERIIERLKEESLDFLVATDIAARGIDISWLRAVINYEMPETAETYIHRTGRTGRAGTVGTAYSFVTPADVSVFHQLNKLFGIRMEPRTLPSREKVLHARADETIEGLLASIDEDQSLEYGRWLAIARRLASRDGGDREVAKLLAFYAREGAADATNDAATGDAPRAHKPQANAQRSDAQPTSATQDAPADRDAPAVDNAPAAAQAQAKTADAPALEGPASIVRAWISENSREDNPCRSAHAVARALEITEDEVNAIAAEDPGLERLSGRNARWRIVSAATSTAEETGAPADVDRPQQAQIRVETDPALDAPAPRAKQDDGRAKQESRAKQEDSRAEQARREEVVARRPYPQAAIESAARKEKKGWVSLRVNVGQNKFRSADDLGQWFSEYAGFESYDIRNVDLREKAAVIEVDECYWRDFIEALHNQPWEGQQLQVHRNR